MDGQTIVGLLTLIVSLMGAVMAASNRGLKIRLGTFEDEIKNSLKSQDGKLDRLSDSFAIIDKNSAVSSQIIAYLQKELSEIKENCRRHKNGDK